MKIHFTKHAEENLTTIYSYHSEYSRDFASDFNEEIIDFLVETLTTHPKIEHVYNKSQSLYRIIFKQRYNIYYLIQDGIIFILYILDGRLLLNEEPGENGIELPTLK